MLVILAAEGPYWGALRGLAFEEVACEGELPAAFPHPIFFLQLLFLMCLGIFVINSFILMYEWLSIPSPRMVERVHLWGGGIPGRPPQLP